MVLLHVAPDQWWTAWHPEVFLFCAFLVGLYWVAVEPLRQRFRLAERAENRYTIPFLLGVFVIFLSEGTPLHTLSEQFLFSAHMFQHILLAMVMPPLVIMGIPPWLMRPLFQLRFARPVGRVLTHPLMGLVLFNAVYAAWHLPGMYQAALYNHQIHMLQHAILVFTALLMWWPLVSRSPELPRLPGPGQVLYVFFMSVAQIAVYSYVTFSHEVLYGFYAMAPRVWNIDPHADQVLAGVIMMLGSMLILFPTLIIVFFRWVSREERRARESSQQATRPVSQQPLRQN